MYNELGEEWVPNHRNRLFEKEESLFKKMAEVGNMHIHNNIMQVTIIIMLSGCL